MTNQQILEKILPAIREQDKREAKVLAMTPDVERIILACLKPWLKRAEEMMEKHGEVDPLLSITQSAEKTAHVIMGFLVTRGVTVPD